MRSRKNHPVLGQSLGVVFLCRFTYKSVKMRDLPTPQYGCYFVLYHSFPIATILFFMRLSDYPSLFTANFVIALNSVNANRLVRYKFNNRHILKSFRKLSLMRFPLIRRSPGLQGFYQSLSLYCNYLLDSFKALYTIPHCCIIYIILSFLLPQTIHITYPDQYPNMLYCPCFH